MIRISWAIGTLTQPAATVRKRRRPPTGQPLWIFVLLAVAIGVALGVAAFAVLR